MATVSDNFDRANGAPGANWTDRGSGTWTISSNQLYQTASAGSYRMLGYTGAALASDNYSVQAACTSLSGSVGPGVCARMPSGTAVTGYGMIIFAGDTCYIVEITAGVESIIDTGTISIVSGTAYTIRLEVEGTAIRGYVNGVLDLSVTDASLTTGIPGLITYGGGSVGTANRWDDFTASDLAAGGSLYLPAQPRMPGALLAR